jgi:hypothetical protein
MQTQVKCVSRGPGLRVLAADAGHGAAPVDKWHEGVLGQNFKQGRMVVRVVTYQALLWDGDAGRKLCHQERQLHGTFPKKHYSRSRHGDPDRSHNQISDTNIALGWEEVQNLHFAAELREN